MRTPKPGSPLRKGWTTGACATAAARAAYEALITGAFPDPVTIRLPRGRRAEFPLARAQRSRRRATAGVIKDAGDDPDVTHGALVLATVEPGEPGTGITFAAGEGVGVVTLPGLGLPVGEPAINPKPREMMRAAITEVAAEYDGPRNLRVTIAVPGGDRLAERTTSARLGIKGGISILGTTGIVIPYSCASWIHSIHRGIDVAREAGLAHVAGATGRGSERAVQKLYGLPDIALIDMGDFVGGMLKYLRRHPTPWLTIAGGFGKLSKLAAGHLDLHSSRSRIDPDHLANLLARAGADPRIVARARAATSAGAIFELSRDAPASLPDLVARGAREVALAALGGGTDLDAIIFDRDGKPIGRAGP